MSLKGVDIIVILPINISELRWSNRDTIVVSRHLETELFFPLKSKSILCFWRVVSGDKSKAKFEIISPDSIGDNVEPSVTR